MENSLRGRGQALGPTPPLPRHIQPQFRRPEEEQKIRLPRVRNTFKFKIISIITKQLITIILLFH